jgi:hypothetical protein
MEKSQSENRTDKIENEEMKSRTSLKLKAFHKKGININRFITFTKKESKK